MIKTIATAMVSLGLATAAAATLNTAVILDEERLARQEEARIITAPIGGIETHFWFDYRANVNEARKELSSDLRHATDTEDRRDAWEEFRQELAHERTHYVKEMAERGYRYGTVTVGS
ncbi:MAG: hypothetical protein J0I80_06930 [Sphingomonas sp.]|nr:hypothetical protein [Sphingomonas sp.]